MTRVRAPREGARRRRRDKRGEARARAGGARRVGSAPGGRRAGRPRGDARSVPARCASAPGATDETRRRAGTPGTRRRRSEGGGSARWRCRGRVGGRCGTRSARALAGVVPQRPNVSFPAELARGERSSPRDGPRLPTHWFSQFPESRILQGSRTVETTGSKICHLRVRASDEPVVGVSPTTPSRSAHVLASFPRPASVRGRMRRRSRSSAALATPLAAPGAAFERPARATTARDVSRDPRRIFDRLRVRRPRV